MKTINFFRFTLLLLVAVMTFSCSDDDEPTPTPEKSITEIVNTNNDFSLLRAALVYANLTSTLQNDGSFTVFAPTNAAFQKAGLTTESAIQALPVETVKDILLYHVLGSKAVSTSLPTANNTAVKTIQESDLFISKSSEGVFVNGAKVTQADINAKNGVIHVIDHVLMPASGTLVDLLANDTRFTYLVAAVVRASEGSVNVKEVIEAAGPFTIFAPTNDAFIEAGFTTVESIQAADPALLTTILTGHVLNGMVFSNAVTNNLTVSSLSEAPLVFAVGNDVTVKGNGNTVPATITAVNWLGSNGVIHVINKVLLP